MYFALLAMIRLADAEGNLVSVDEGCSFSPRQRVGHRLFGRNAWSYFLPFFSARFSFMVLAGFFLVSLRASWFLPMGVLLVL